MKYEFPIIRTIDDVLPHIKDREEFVVAERPGYVVVNYLVAMSDTFAMTGPDDIGGAIRRECRGLIFDATGKIISRPIHKVFNLGEREDTNPVVVPWGELSHFEDKLDGSMVRPFIANGDLVWGTKMGKTDFSDRVADFVSSSQVDYVGFAHHMIEQQITPVFEWTSPDDRIVIGYETPNLTLLLARDNFTGRYLSIHP